MKKLTGTSNASIKSRILNDKLLPYKCANKRCKVVDKWLGKPITLHLEHKNGDNTDNTISNLEFLCPNCHSQTSTYTGKNNKAGYNSKNKKVTDKDMVKALRTNSSISKALKSVGLAGAGNYRRCYKLIELYDITI